jgi:hypothetical protein
MRESVTEWRVKKLAEKNARHQKRVMSDALWCGIAIGIVVFCFGMLNLDHDIKMGIILLVTGMCWTLFCFFVRIWWT